MFSSHLLDGSTPSAIVEKADSSTSSGQASGTAATKDNASASAYGLSRGAIAGMGISVLVVISTAFAWLA